MTIRKGSDWGERGALPRDGVVASSDAAARHLLETARREGSSPPVIGLTGGDLWRTLGGVATEGRLRSDDAVTFAVDAVCVTLDDERHWFVAHLVARTPGWGRALLAMNAEWLGPWDVAPRAHPGDGLVDLYEARLPLAERLKVRGRLRHGAHLPHPGIRERRTATSQVDLGRRLAVWLDGERVGSAGRIAVSVEPDALRVVV